MLPRQSRFWLYIVYGRYVHGILEIQSIKWVWGKFQRQSALWECGTGWIPKTDCIMGVCGGRFKCLALSSGTACLLMWKLHENFVWVCHGRKYDMRSAMNTQCTWICFTFWLIQTKFHNVSSKESISALESFANKHFAHSQLHSIGWLHFLD